MRRTATPLVHFSLPLPADGLIIRPERADQEMIVLFIFQEVVDFRAIEDHGHTEMQPQQKDHHTGQTAINIRKIIEIANVE